MIGRRLVRGLVIGLGEELGLPFFVSIGSVEVGDDRGGIGRSTSAVVVSRCDEGVREAAIRRTKGIGAGAHVQRRAKGRTGRFHGYCRRVSSGGGTIVGGGLEECRSRSRRSGCGDGELN